MSELAHLMEEPPGGPNCGRAVLPIERDADGRGASDRGTDLSPGGAQVAEFMRDGGWTIVHSKDGTRGGVKAHRGAVHPDEHVDPVTLRAGVEDALGFTAAEVHSVYSTGGRIPGVLRDLRDSLDARLLEISSSGANMALLGRTLGIEYDPTIKRALRRARKQGVSRMAYEVDA